MAQLPKKYEAKIKKTLNKRGFLFSVLSGYGIKDWHINVLVLLFFIFFFLNIWLINKSILSFYNVTKILGGIIGLSFLCLYSINRYLVLSSAFWQPRFTLLIMVPAFLFMTMLLNYTIAIDRKTELLKVIRWTNNSVYLKNANGEPLNATQERMYRFHPDAIYGVEADLAPSHIEIYQHQGIFGIWMVDGEQALYLK